MAKHTFTRKSIVLYLSEGTELRIHCRGIEGDEKKPSTRWDSNPRPQEFFSAGMWSTAVLHLLPSKWSIWMPDIDRFPWCEKWVEDIRTPVVTIAVQMLNSGWDLERTRKGGFIWTRLLLLIWGNPSQRNQSSLPPFQSNSSPLSWAKMFPDCFCLH